MPAVGVNPKNDELHVGLEIPTHTARQIHQWVRQQPWPEGTELEHPQEYHITLLYSSEGNAQHKDAWWLEHMEHAEVKTTSVTAFPSGEKGGYAYVLLIESDDVKAKAEEMQGRAEAWGVPISKFDGGYKPHITVGYGPSDHLTGIDKPQFRFDVGPSSVSPMRPKKETVTASAPPEPPNYRKQDKPSEHCGNCKMFTKGLCWGYGNRPVEKDYVCDSWSPETKQSFGPKESRPLTDDFFDQWNQRNPEPVLYHGTQPAALPDIMKHGLLPWDHPDNPVGTNYRDQPWIKPRPSHVYFSQDPYRARDLASQNLWAVHREDLKPAVLKIDRTKLDPRNINPDEDDMVHHWGDEYPSPETPPPPGHREGPYNTLGEAAEHFQWGNNPTDTQSLIDLGSTVAYRGIVPPHAITPGYMAGNEWRPLQQLDNGRWPQHFGRVAYNPDEVKILDHLSLTSVAANLHYKFEEGGLDAPAATEYAKRLLKLIGYPPDDITVEAALQAWHQLYPDDRTQPSIQGPPTVPTESWAYGTTSRYNRQNGQEGDPPAQTPQDFSSRSYRQALAEGPQGDEAPQIEPFFPSLEDAVEANQASLEGWGQTNHALLRPDTLEGALGRPQQYWHYTGSLPQTAAALAHGVSQAQAFEDGNKRTAYWLTHHFLHENGLGHIAPSDDEELARHIVGYGEGTHTLDHTAQMFENRLAPEKFAATRRDLTYSFDTKVAGLAQYAEMVPIEAVKHLREYDRTPGLNPEVSADPEYWGRLKADIAQHGFSDPLTLEYNPSTGKGYLGEGNHRLGVAEELGMSDVPLMVYRTSKDDERMKYMHAPETYAMRNEHGFSQFPQYAKPSQIGLPVTGEYQPGESDWYDQERARMEAERATQQQAQQSQTPPESDPQPPGDKTPLDPTSQSIMDMLFGKDARTRYTVGDGFGPRSTSGSVESAGRGPAAFGREPDQPQDREYDQTGQSQEVGQPFGVRDRAQGIRPQRRGLYNGTQPTGGFASEVLPPWESKGLTVLHEETPDQLRIHTLELPPGLRGQGYGHRFMKHLKAYSDAKGKPVVIDPVTNPGFFSQFDWLTPGSSQTRFEYQPEGSSTIPSEVNSIEDHWPDVGGADSPKDHGVQVSNEWVYTN